MPPRLLLRKPHSFPAPGTPARPCMSPHVVMTSTSTGMPSRTSLGSSENVWSEIEAHHCCASPYACE